jgi:hypothetical protein
MDSQNGKPDSMPKMPQPILEQTAQTKGEKMTTPNTETQGKTTKTMDKLEENQTRFTKDNDGLRPTRQLFNTTRLP